MSSVLPYHPWLVDPWLIARLDVPCTPLDLAIFTAALCLCRDKGNPQRQRKQRRRAAHLCRLLRKRRRPEDEQLAINVETGIWP